MHTIQNKNHQQGFTLIEIGIVLFVIGIMIAIFLPSFTQGIKDTAKATHIATALPKIAESADTIAKECNVSISDVLYNVPDGTASKNFFHMMNEGVNSVATAYKACYTRANVSANPIFDTNALPKIEKISTTIGNFTGSNGRPSVMFTLYAPPPEIVVALMNKYAGTSLTVATLNPLGDLTSNPVFGYYYVSGVLRLRVVPNL